MVNLAAMLVFSVLMLAAEKHKVSTRHWLQRFDVTNVHALGNLFGPSRNRPHIICMPTVGYSMDRVRYESVESTMYSR